MVENIRLSFQGIWAHKMRSFLTMLGIVIGIASIIAIVSTIKGTNEQIKQNLVGSGDNTVNVQLYNNDYQYEFQYNGMPEGIAPLDESILNTIIDLDEVENASFYLKREAYGSVYYQNNSLQSGYLIGGDKNYINTSGYVLKKGRGLTEDDYDKFRKVIIIESSIQDTLFNGEDAIGKTIEVGSEPFTVIGVVEKSNKFEPVINSIEDYNTYFQESGGLLLIPDTTWPIVYAYDEQQNIMLKAVSTDDIGAAGKKTVDLLNANIISSNESIKYKAENILEQAKELQDLSSATNQQLIWIASISLLVGGIGVMNIMLVSVTERTREIGLKKAIGARKTQILIEFLTEAAVLTSIGGILGVLGGIILSKLISSISEAPVAISVPAIVGGVVFSMLIGIIFGLLPSYKAANLNPIEALRHE